VAGFDGSRPLADIARSPKRALRPMEAADRIATKRRHNIHRQCENEPGARHPGLLVRPMHRLVTQADASRVRPWAGASRRLPVTRRLLADARETPTPGATVTPRQSLNAPASHRSGQIKTYYGAPVGAAWRWTYFPSLYQITIRQTLAANAAMSVMVDDVAQSDGSVLLVDDHRDHLVEVAVRVAPATASEHSDGALPFVPRRGGANEVIASTDS